MRSNYMNTYTTKGRIAAIKLPLPLALATLSTTAAAINSCFLPFIFNYLDRPLIAHPLSTQLINLVPPCWVARIP